MRKLANLKGVKMLNKSQQKTIVGRGSFCCEWCPDGSCLDWVSSPRVTCPFAAAC